MLKKSEESGAGLEYTGYTKPAAESPLPSTYRGQLSAHKRHAPDAACTAMRPEYGLWKQNKRRKIAK